MRYEYLIRRFLLMIPTLLGITLVTFFIAQSVPGGPVEQALTALRFGGGGGGGDSSSPSSAGGMIDEDYVQALKKHYGFDKPIHIRYYIWLKGLISLDFGESYYYEEPVLDVIVSRFPISLTFGIVSLLLSYFICIPLGIMKTLRHRKFFDDISSIFVYIGYAVPGYALLLLMIVLFCGGSHWDIFPMQGFTSENFDELTFFGKKKKSFKHPTR